MTTLIAIYRLYEEIVRQGLCWYVASVPFALSVYPLCRRCFPLNTAWGMARLLGPWLVTWLAISPVIFLKKIPFSVSTILSALAITFVSCFVVNRLCSERTKAEPREETKALIRCESHFLLYFLLFLSLLPFVSVIHPYDQLGDAAKWNAVWEQKQYPVSDPWLGGRKLTYYIFGYLSNMSITFISNQGQMPSYFFTVASTMATSAFAIYVFLIGLTRRRTLQWFIPLVVCLAHHPRAIERLILRLLFETPVNQSVYTCLYTEFPCQPAVFDFFFSVLHPDYLALPILLTFLPLAGPLLFESKTPRSKEITIFCVISSLLVGWLWGANGWDVPIVVALFFLVMSFSLYKMRKTRFLVVFLPVFFALSVLVSLPFWTLMRKAPIRFEMLTSNFTSLYGLFHIWVVPFLMLTVVTLRQIRFLKRRWLFLIPGLVLAIGLCYGSSRIVLVAFILLCLLMLLDSGDLIPREGIFFLFIGFSVALIPELVRMIEPLGFGRGNLVIKWFPRAFVIATLGTLLLLQSCLKSQKTWAKIFYGTLVFCMSSVAITWILYGDPGTRPYSIDGLARIAKELPKDMGLIRWLQSGNLVYDKRSGYLLEMPGPYFSEEIHSRFVSMSGISGYNAYSSNHSHAYDIHFNDPEIKRRLAVAKNLYEKADSLYPSCDMMRSALRSESIKIVAIGEIEQRHFAPSSLFYLQKCLPLLHKEGESMLLIVPSQ